MRAVPHSFYGQESGENKLLLAIEWTPGCSRSFYVRTSAAVILGRAWRDPHISLQPAREISAWHEGEKAGNFEKALKMAECARITL